MPAVSPLLAIVAPAAVAARAPRPEYLPLPLPSAQAPAAPGARDASQAPADAEESPEKSFARVLEEGMERQSEQRESRRSQRSEAERRDETDRKEDAAAQADSGSMLPADGRPLPPAESAGQALAAMTPTAPAFAETAAAVFPDSAPLSVANLPDAAGVQTLSLSQPFPEDGLPATATASSSLTTGPTTLLIEPAPQPAVAAAQGPAGDKVAQPPVVATPAPTLPPDGMAELAKPVVTSLAAVATETSTATASADSQSGPALLPVPPVAAAQSAGESLPEPSVSDRLGKDPSTNPFAALRQELEADARNAAEVSEQQAAVTEQDQRTASALAQASGTQQSALLDVTPGQGDLAERVRAWRGLSGAQGMASTSLFARSEAAGSSLFSQVSGQLQQFADSLRQAVSQAEAPSLLPGTERGTSSAGPTVAPGALSSAAASSVSTEPGGAWRADNLQMPGVTGSARPAAGTLQFMQTMQPSSFGAALGETFGQNAWAESVTQRVAMMTGQKLSSALIELDPPELGALTVKVSVSGDQASVSFASPHAIVRDALEQTFPRLQEMLSQQGLQLADAQVSDQSAERRQSGDAGSGSASAAAERSADGLDAVAVQNVKVATSLIDYYA